MIFFKKNLIYFIIVIIFIQSSNKSDNTDENANENTDLKQFIERYEIDNSKPIEDIKIDEASYINKLHIPGLVGQTYSTNNLILSMIDQLNPVNSMLDNYYWVSHIEFLNSALSSGYEIRFKAAYNPPNENPQFLLPYYIEFKGKLLKGKEFEHTEILGWTILRLEITDALTCKIHVKIENQDSLEIQFCKNVNQDVQTLLNLQSKIYLIANGKSSHSISILFPQYESPNAIYIQDQTIDSEHMAQIPFFRSIPSIDILSKASLRLQEIQKYPNQFVVNTIFPKAKDTTQLKNSNPVTNPTTPSPPTSTFTSQQNIGKIAIYKIDQFPYPYYELKSIIKKY